MFPSNNPTINQDTRTTDKVVNTHIGKVSFAYDFDAMDFVVEDGRPKEVSGAEALAVWIQKIFHTQKNRYHVYENTEYGVLVEDLIVGARYTVDFVESELRRELEDAVKQNEQIIGVSSFASEYTGGNTLHVHIALQTIFGALQATTAIGGDL